MGKSPGFWFFVGDWMKDPELRFCSLFARGLLVDLLCLMFEAKTRGYLSKPNGEPRSDLDIVNAISGGTCDEKMEALRELEHSGVLSRDENGVLFSRRIARLDEVSKERSKAGSKGGSKAKAKHEANENQNDKQKRGVTVSVSDSVSDSFSPLSPPAGDQDEIKIPAKHQTGRVKKACGDWRLTIPIESTRGKPANDFSLETTLVKLAEYSEPKACGYVLAWISERRVFPYWKSDWENFKPPELIPPREAEENYGPRKKPEVRKVVLNG